MSSQKKPGWKTLPIGGVVLEPGSSTNYKTGEWRAFRPVLDPAKCVNCLTCWIFCPDIAIKKKEKTVEIDYEFCKGCGICANECPTKAITMKEE